MLRQFIYKPEHIGLIQWPSGELRLEGIEITDDPHSADIFVCPGNIRLFEATAGTGILDHARLYSLPYFAGNESRHVFFDCSDNFKAAIRLPILFLKCDARTWMLPHDPGTIQIAWPVEDYAECMELPDRGFIHDISFHGWLSTDTRTASSNACLDNPKLKADIAQYTDFFGYRKPEDPEYTRRRAAFRRSMRDSRLALCPESIPGVLPYRFFEAMSAGRIPLLVSSDYVLPFATEIPYDDFIIRVESRDASQADAAALAYLDGKADHELIDRGLEARHYWLKYLDARRWPEIMSYAVTKKLEARGEYESTSPQARAL